MLVFVTTHPLTILFANMENANPSPRPNPNLTPEEVASLCTQIEGEISDLRELNREIDFELERALSDLGTTIYSDNFLKRNDITIEKLINRYFGGETLLRTETYFDLYPTKEEVAYYKHLVDSPRPPFVRIDPKIKLGDPGNVKIPCMIGYQHIKHAYIDIKSPVNVMSSSLYSRIMNMPLEPMIDPKYPGGVCNFVGRVKDIHILVGNFTFTTNFMILEDMSSVIDSRLSHVVLGKPFVEASSLKYDHLHGTVQFSNDVDKITYRMPYRVKEFRFISRMENDYIGATEDINDEEKEKGMEYVWRRRSLYYKDCLNLGPKYKVDLEVVRMIKEAMGRENGET